MKRVYWLQDIFTLCVCNQFLYIYYIGTQREVEYGMYVHSVYRTTIVQEGC